MLTFHQTSAVGGERVEITAAHAGAEQLLFRTPERLLKKSQKKKLYCDLLFISLIHVWSNMAFDFDFQMYLFITHVKIVVKGQ